jgi:ABC-2 type transport system ATP-binding protein
MSLIAVENLRKTYRRAERRAGTLGAFTALFRRATVETVALDDLSFAIEPGELVGYIGPNGAGKSTTVKILSGIILPDSGRCIVDGLVPWEERRRHVAKIGVVFGQRPQLWWDLPVIESFDLLRDIYRLRENDYRETRDELVERMGIGGFLNQPVRQLSLGQRMRADLVASLLHRPQILFLDEPTIGLDAPGKLAVRDFVRSINRDLGVTVLLTTHDMDDIEALATRLLVIGKGRIIADGTIDMLHERLGLQRRIVADIDPAADGGGGNGPADSDLQNRVIRAGGTIVREPGRITVTIDPGKTPVPELLSLITKSYTVRDVFIEAPPIEEIVARIYETGGVDR